MRHRRQPARAGPSPGSIGAYPIVRRALTSGNQAEQLPPISFWHRGITPRSTRHPAHSMLGSARVGRDCRRACCPASRAVEPVQPGLRGVRPGLPGRLRQRIPVSGAQRPGRRRARCGLVGPPQRTAWAQQEVIHSPRQVGLAQQPQHRDRHSRTPPRPSAGPPWAPGRHPRPRPCRARHAPRSRPPPVQPRPLRRKRRSDQVRRRAGHDAHGFRLPPALLYFRLFR